MAIVIAPGLNNSGPDHWQTWFERQFPNTSRVQQRDWAEPDLPSWAAAVNEKLQDQTGPAWIVAHSFGCLASSAACNAAPDRVAGLLLVAPADPDKFGVADLLPQRPLPAPSTLVASTSDPWMHSEKAFQWAEKWGSKVINLGDAGHINPDSGFGAWPQILDIFEDLRARAYAPSKAA